MPFCPSPLLSIPVCGLLGEKHSQWLIRSALGEHRLSGPAGASVLVEASLRHNLLLSSRQPRG